MKRFDIANINNKKAFCTYRGVKHCLLKPVLLRTLIRGKKRGRGERRRKGGRGRRRGRGRSRREKQR